MGVVRAVDGTAPRVFRRSLVGAAIQALVVSVVIVVAAIVVVPGLLPISTSRTTRATLTAVVIAVLLVAVWGSLLWLRNLSVIVTTERVTIRRPLGEVAAFARNETRFGSTVTQNRVNGMPSSVTRTLIARGPHGETRLDLTGFSRSTFNALIATVSPLAEAVPDAVPRSVEAVTFTLDATGLRARGRKIAWAAVFTGAVSLGASAVGFRAHDDTLRVVGCAVAIFVFVLTFGLAIGAAQIASQARRHPARVTVSGIGVSIDGTDHPYASLSRIWVTPTAYARSSIQIIDQDGCRSTWPLVAPGVSLSPDYLVFVHALRIATHHHPGLVALDLE